MCNNNRKENFNESAVDMSKKCSKVALRLSLVCLIPIYLYAFDLADPFSVSESTKKSVLSCAQLDLSKEMGLTELVNYALCNNPDTKLAWIGALYQAEQLGAAKSAYLPTISASASVNGAKQHSKNVDTFTNTNNASINFSYLLYDFGARGASIENAKKLLDAANATQSAKVQSLFGLVIQSYYNLFAAKASLEAYKEAQKLAKESYEAALAKYQVGMATPADKLQALTAYSQATLNTVRAEGNLRNAQAILSNTLGLDANVVLNIRMPSVDVVDEDFSRNIEEMIKEAKKSRPDLAAAQAQIEAAKALQEAAKASGKPTISLSSSVGYADSSAYDSSKNSSIGIFVNIPIFTGFNTTYKVRAAEAQTKIKELEFAKLEKQVALDVYKSYNNLVTETASIKASKDLLRSAEQSMKMASGRYKAGVGSIIDLLSAQSALASAQQQSVEALYNWYIAKATLAQSMGKLNFTEIENISGRK